jgi:hypothetical protein
MTDDDTTPFLDDLPDLEDVAEVEPDPEPRAHDDAEVVE